MMRRLTALTATAALLASTGCVTYSLEELRHVTPRGSSCQNALSREYLTFASSEEAQYDWWDAIYFADKGLRAAYGKDVAPEELANWDIPADKKEEMALLRTQLVSALASGAAAQPELAARAQVYFDCWVEQQEEGWQSDDINRCRDGLSDTLSQLGGESMAGPIVPAPAMEPAMEKPIMAEETMAEEVVIDTPPPPAPRAATREEYIVFFEKHEVTPSAFGQRVIEEVLQSLKEEDSYEITLSSHTDTVGDPRENLIVSEQRAQAVKDRLVAGGVREGRIKVFAYGESDPPISTGDEVDEPANRRVEIVLSE